uniref:Uncharacterized protein n=1 Tax=Arundo donax TaxID=35708 RepID=A0A0A9HVS2_ARUDO
MKLKQKSCRWDISPVKLTMIMWQSFCRQHPPTLEL